MPPRTLRPTRRRRVRPGAASAPTPPRLKRLPAAPEGVAPDGMEVRTLLGLRACGMAHFRLEPGQTGRAVRHRTVEEVWYFLSGEGRMWRSLGADERIDAVGAGTCVDLPVGTSFQLRVVGEEPLSVVAVTAPPWPGPDEAVRVAGRWRPRVPSRRARPPAAGRRRR